MFLQRGNGSITILAATPRDSGTYFCNVSLSLIGEGSGDGTVVTVTGNGNPKDYWTSVWVILGSLAFVLLVGGVGLYLSRSRFGGKGLPLTVASTEAEEPENVLYADLNLRRPREREREEPRAQPEEVLYAGVRGNASGAPEGTLYSSVRVSRTGLEPPRAPGPGPDQGVVYADVKTCR
eukprot:gi/632992148/ref/XP_007884947.1/ PREDICTED: uncharacterized protein LOC103174322 [Callorhinchus milii]